MSSIIRATTTSGLQVAPDNSGSLQLQTNGTTAAVTIDTSQNVGIGVTPAAWNSRGKAVQIGNGSVNTSLFSLSSGLNGLANNMYVTASADNYIASDYATRYYQYAGTHVWDTAASGTAGNAITFTERMRIDSSGNVLVGTTSQPYGTSKLVVSSASNNAAYIGTSYAGDVSNPALYISKYDNNGTTSQVFVRFLVSNNSAGSGQINANGASAVAFGSWSDARLKENIEPLPSQLDNIMALKPSEFDYKGYENGAGHQIGFIAQDMQEVYPDVVSEGDDGILMITGWDKTTARLVKAIQEQQTIINDLKARVTALEAK